MHSEIFWRLPVAGDGRSGAASAWRRGDYSEERADDRQVFARTGAQRDGYTYYDILLQVARAAELVGFDGVWIPESPRGEDPLIVAGSVAREVTRLRLVPTLRAAFLSAVYATKIAVSFQRLTGGRLSWNLTTTDQSEGSHWHGRRWTESEQLRRTEEFLDVAKGFWHATPFTYHGEFYEVVDGGFPPALSGETFPRVFLAGTSEASLALSAKHADVHFLPLAPIEQLLGQIAALNELARKHGRSVAIGIETPILARHDARDAWAEAEREWEDLRGRAVPVSEAIGLRGAAHFEGTRVDANLWSGFGALTSTPILGLVGSYAQIAERLREYATAGVSTFVLGAHPHLEEAYTLGEHLLPAISRPAEPARRAS